MQDEIKEAYSAFTDAWRFYKQHWEIPKDDADWELLCGESENACRSSRSPLLRGLLREVIEDIKRRYEANENQNAGS